MTVESVREVPVGAPPSKMSWGAIFGGAVAALGLWILLYALGMAIGFSAVNPDNPRSLQGSGIFTGLWSVISPLIALFVGGIVAGRGAGVTTRLGGATHGLVMWGLTTLAGAWLLTSLVGALASGAASVGKAAAQAGGGVQKVAGELGLDADDALGPVNQRLAAQGKPTVTGDQLKAAVGDVVKQAANSGGQVDSAQLEQAVARNTSLTGQDAREVSTRIQAQLSQAKGQLSQTALSAVDVTGKAFWGVFGALLLGLVSAVLGATIGVSPRQHRLASASVATRREVYP